MVYLPWVDCLPIAILSRGASGESQIDGMLGTPVTSVSLRSVEAMILVEKSRI